MVEGDGCHRIAAKHRKELVGRKLSARSPNGRFRGGAQAIMKCGGTLLSIEVHGKNMPQAQQAWRFHDFLHSLHLSLTEFDGCRPRFYFFGRPGKAPSVVMHVHFGLAGAFAVYKGEEPVTLHKG